MTPHKWQKEIIAWSNGSDIEQRYLLAAARQPLQDWEEFDGIWRDGFEYRIKPEAPKYPQTRMTENELAIIVGEHHPFANVRPSVYKVLANAVLARACEDGDLTPVVHLGAGVSIADGAVREPNIPFDMRVENGERRVTAFGEEWVPASMLEKVAEAVRLNCRAEHIITWNLVGSDMAMKNIDLKAIIASVKEKKDA